MGAAAAASRELARSAFRGFFAWMRLPPLGMTPWEGEMGASIRKEGSN